MGVLLNSKTATTGFALNTSPSLAPIVPDTPTGSAPALPPRPSETTEEKTLKKEKQLQLEQQKREEEKQRWLKEDERRNLEAQRLQEQARKQDAEFQASLVQFRCTECGEQSHKAGKCRRCQEKEAATLTSPLDGEEEDKFDKNDGVFRANSSSSSNGGASSGGARAKNGLMRLIRPLPKKQEPLESMSEILAKHGTVGRMATPWASASASSPSAAASKEHAARTVKANDWAMLQVFLFLCLLFLSISLPHE